MRRHFIIIAISLLPLALFAHDIEPQEVDPQVQILQQDSVQESKSLLQNVIDWYDRNTNYASIAALMAVESSFVPFPSEVVIPPAAYIASEEDSDLNIFLVILFGTLGALIGAYINYFLALWLGRPIVYKLADTKVAHWLLIDREGVEKAEKYFVEHGNASTFIGRFIPAIRQLISIPAGLSKMNLASFTLFTFLGAFIWNAVLALLGYLAHGQKDLIEKYSHELSIILVVLLAVAVVIFVIKQFRKKNA